MPNRHAFAAAAESPISLQSHTIRKHGARPLMFAAKTDLRSPRIRGVVPVVRHAVLVRHSPPLTDDDTKAAAEALRQIWNELRLAYVEQIANIAGITAADLQFVETEATIGHRYDGDTPMIDLQRIRTRRGVRPPFDQRNCAALCVKDASSKMWTRVGLPERRSGYPLTELAAIIDKYRHQARDSSDWFAEEFHARTRAAFGGHTSTVNPARLEVTTVGLRITEAYTEDELDAWIWNGDSPNLANERLCEYVAAAAHMDVPSVQRIAEIDSDMNYWLAVPSTIITASGSLISRRTLYLGRTVGDVVQFVGIGFDDSARGDLANDVARKFSRLIAHAI